MIDKKKLIELLSAVAVDGRVKSEVAASVLNATEGFSLEEYGIDNIIDFFEELGEPFSVEGNDIKIPSVPKPQPFDEAAYCKGVVSVLLKMDPEQSDLLPLTSVGSHVRAAGLTLPSTLRLSEIVQRHPEIFEFDATDMSRFKLRVRKKGSVTPPTLPVPPAPPVPGPTPVPTAKSAAKVSPYAISVSFSFRDMPQCLSQLASLAVEDGWFVLDDEAEKNPYRMLNYKLQINFANAVRRSLQGDNSDFSFSVWEARFRTGFVTAEGRDIIMVCVFNSCREASTPAPWIFDRFETA